MKRYGFTLIELLIVVAIIAILAAIAVPNFLEAQTRAKVSRTKADMRTLATGLEAYRVDANKLPPMADWWATDTGKTYKWTEGDTFHSRIPNFITTPIAYVTSTYEDVFIPNLNPIPTFGRYTAVTRVGRRYVYFNYAQFNIDTPSPTWAARSEITNQWMFYSYGPDNDTNQVPAGGTVGTNKPGKNGTYTRYDASNGTVSLGNIIRTGASGDGNIPYSAALSGNSTNGPN